MKILHLLSAGGIGGIEILCRDISRLSRDDNEFCCLFKGGEIAVQMSDAGVPVYFLYKENKMKRLLHLHQLVSQNQYDAVVVHHEGLGIYLAYLLCMLFHRDVKFIKYLHCSFEPEYFYVKNWLKDRLNYLVLRLAVKKSDRLIAVSKFVKKSYVEEFGIPDDKVKVIYNGVRVAEECCCKDEDRSKQPIVILYVGRLVQVKGVQVLLRAVKLLLDQGYDVVLEVLGDGPSRTDYEKLAETLGIKEKVRFRGYRLDKEIFFSQAHVFCYPSVWQEAFGISIIEAMQKGLVCVASAVGGIPEIITDGRDGYLVESGDEKKLADVLRKTISDYQTGRASQIQDAAIKRAKDFDVHKMIDALSEIYR